MDQPKIPVHRKNDDVPLLYGILWDEGGKSIALINDVEAQAGDTVDGYVVKEIRPDVVILEDSMGETEELRLEFDLIPQ